jgi:aromatic-L-amino-acid/L-tryptophan decarboxylase
LQQVVQDSSHFEIVTPPSLALIVVRLHPDRKGQSITSDAELNLLNQRLHNNLSARHDLMLTQTILHSVEREIFCLRIAIGGVHTTWLDVESVWHTIEEEGRKLVVAS